MNNLSCVFISFAPKNIDRIIPLIRVMKEKDICFWFDENIFECRDNDWKKVVKEKIIECEKFVCFLSDEYTKSSKCLWELNCAIDKNKPIMQIQLDEVVGGEADYLLRTTNREEKQNGLLQRFSDLLNNTFFENCHTNNSLNDSETSKFAILPPKIDSVQFSALAPKEISKNKYFPINIMMYEDEYRKEVDDIISLSDEIVEETKSGYHDVKRNSLVKICLSSPDFEIEDASEEKNWYGKYLNFKFPIKIPADYSEPQIIIVASVYINDLIATKLKMILDCTKPSKQNISITRKDVSSAFVSYASQDRAQVATIIQGMKKARPDMDIFFDVESLRSGQRWEETLKNEIENRDVLFLCWSKYAKESAWVDLEWRYALEINGEDGIEPIPIDSPNICPPPEELNKKHFNDKMLYIIKSNF